MRSVHTDVLVGVSPACHMTTARTSACFLCKEQAVRMPIRNAAHHCVFLTLKVL